MSSFFYNSETVKISRKYYPLCESLTDLVFTDFGYIDYRMTMENEREPT